MTATPAIGFRDLTLGYDRRPAVHHVSGEVAPGELLALVGPNGAGKSTLLKGIMGEVTPLGGTIDRQGLSHRDIAYLPQQIDVDRSFPISVFDCVAMGFWREIGIWRGLDTARKRAVAKALTTLGILDLANRPIGALSGGQFQRVLFARLLLQESRLILLDEPFRAVDAKTVADLIALIKRWHAEGRTVIAALHDIEQVRAHFDRTLLLAREVVTWGDTPKVLTQENLAKARHAVEAWEAHPEVCERDEQVQVKEREPA
ncbi:MAG: zinc ABC transporter ATP-binding protein AztA [Methyloceanibacter sp.]|jgi:zinc/manganese transport system ATP-binding protein